MLEIRALAAGYGRRPVIDEIAIDVPAGGVVGLIGANSAGKTTLLRSISGMTRIARGEIRFEGKPIARLSSERIVELGIVHVPQGRMLFPGMSVAENLDMGAYSRRARGYAAANRKRVEALFPILAERRGQSAGVLSGGEQQMLAIGRAMMAEPRLLMLDEPSLGLAPQIVDAIFGVIAGINAGGVAILIAEQNVEQVLRISRHCYVLGDGRIAFSGNSAELARDERIRKTYLGAA
jgi:branched-chain amino acid transport system ATP-binding protein